MRAYRKCAAVWVTETTGCDRLGLVRKKKFVQDRLTSGDVLAAALPGGEGRGKLYLTLRRHQTDSVSLPSDVIRFKRFIYCVDLKARGRRGGAVTIRQCPCTHD